MTSHPVLRVPATLLTEEVRRLQDELEVGAAFPAAVEEAARAAAASPSLPQLDRTDLPLLTIDPDGARDLDQALHVERAPGDSDGPDGWTVHYAIADVAAFVRAGDPVDLEAHRRGETLYGPGGKVPLHPPALSEEAASLLPDQVRPALLWTIRLGPDGERVAADVRRALVRSREQLTYEEAQRRVDAGEGGADGTLALLAEVGPLRMAREVERGGVSLPIPEQEVVVDSGRWHLEHRARLPVEEWNAQVSLLTGFSAAAMMLEGGVGLLRTLPPPDPRDVQRLHRTARALGIGWPAEQSYADFIRGLDPTRADHAAMVVACTRLLRGSGYTAFDGTLPEQPLHGALASAYAHVTAPLRRLPDRYAGEVCLALCAGTEVPGWVRAALPGLPATMQRSGQKASAYERGVLDLVEAGVLRDRVGEEMDAVVVDVEERRPERGRIVVPGPAVEARIEGDAPLPLGQDLRVRLVEADVAQRRVLFAPA
jgi:exoribonuclease R